MGESGMLASSISNNSTDNAECFIANTPVNDVRRLIQQLKNSEHKSLISFSNNCRMHQRIEDRESFEIFLWEGLIEEARKNLRKYFNLSYFLCMFCGEILEDPVTLKCGHSFSKKCLLLEAESFTCCKSTYSVSYISALKVNLVMSSVIQKFWGFQGDQCSIAMDRTDLLKNFDAFSSFIENPSTKDCLIIGSKLVKFDRYQEAIHLLLICFVFNFRSVQMKHQLKEYLQKCFTFSLQNSVCDLQNANSSRITGYANMTDNSSQHIDSKLKQDMNKLINKLCEDLDKLTGDAFVKGRFSKLNLDKKEFDCVLCTRILFEPFTTPCGHTFCRTCYNRCLDYQTDCPLCKSVLVSRYDERIQKTDEFTELLLKTVYLDDYNERKDCFLKEMHRLLNAGNSPEDELPLFVCTIAFPTVPCPLHIFEPRYRHMIRQCVESGSNKFGMCAYIDSNSAEYGTILEIQKVDYLDDGRSIVKTVGRKRFHILKRGERDGHQTAFVETISDDVSLSNSLADLEQFHDRLYKIYEGWFFRLPKQTKDQILQHFGRMPRNEPNELYSSDGPSWMWWILAILPMEQKSLVSILSMTSLVRRLKTFEKIFVHLAPTV